MPSQTDFAYVQARLQARRGERPNEAAWAALAATTSFAEYVERVEQTPLRRFTGLLGRSREPHAIEQAMRRGWRGYVAEVAEWLPQKWQPSVRWTAHVLDLPIRHGAQRIAVPPAWMAADPLLARSPFADQDASHRGSRPKTKTKSPDGVLEAWIARWWGLVPAGDREPPSPVAALAREIGGYLARPERQSQSSEDDRASLDRLLSRRFRRDALTPAAVFEHLALTAIAVERLRGGLVRRACFAEPQQP